MTDAETQLEAIGGGEDWLLVGAEDFKLAAGSLAQALSALQHSDAIVGATGDAARRAAADIVTQLEVAQAMVTKMTTIVSAANEHRKHVAKVVDKLPEPSGPLIALARGVELVTLVPSAGTSVVAGEAAIALVKRHVAGERAAAAQAQLERTAAFLDEQAAALDAAQEFPPEPDPEPEPGPGAFRPSRAALPHASAGAPMLPVTGALPDTSTVPSDQPGATPTTTSPDPGEHRPTPHRTPDPITGGDPVRTWPGSGHAGPVISVDGDVHGRSDLYGGARGTGVDAGLGAGGVGVSGGSRGLAGALVGGSSLGSAAMLARGSGGLGAGGLGAGGLGARGAGAGGLAGSNAPGAVGGLAGAPGAADGSGRQGAGTSAMLGGQGGRGKEKTQRRGLGGIVAPTLDDDPDAVPLPPSAGSGSR